MQKLVQTAIADKFGNNGKIGGLLDDPHQQGDSGVFQFPQHRQFCVKFIHKFICNIGVENLLDCHWRSSENTEMDYAKTTLSYFMLYFHIATIDLYIRKCIYILIVLLI